jgi:serine/threonine protein kinase
VNRIGQSGGQAYKLLGNYRLTRLLGLGGFADVYLGEHTYLGTTAAIKVLHTHVSQAEAAPFLQEARLLASLRHPHIVRIFDFGIDNQTPYLVMDYAPNGTLSTRYPRGSQLPVSTVVEYVKQVADALQYAHDRQIVHRDVKPANMLIGEHNEILLSDFGIALISHNPNYQTTKDVAGTAAYMAPEQISAHPRPASDQYSLGVVAYEWLCGTVPFHGSLTEIVTKHSCALPPSLREYLPILSPDVERVILTALAKQPEERFASMHAFATALEQASQQELPIEYSRPLAGSSPLYPLPLSQGLVDSLSSTVPAFSTLPPVQPDPLAKKKSDKSVVSRRTVLISAVGGAIIGAAGASLFTYRYFPQVRPIENLPFIYRGHSDTVWGVTWSPNEQRIASASSDRTAQVWNVGDGGNVLTYTGHPISVASVAWSPDGKRLASASGDATVQIWNASDGNDVLTYRGHAAVVQTLAWSPNGQQMASGSRDNTVQVWNVSDGRRLFTYRGHSDWVESVKWSPDGTQLVSCSRDHTAQVWSASNGSHLFTYRGHSDIVLEVGWSPDGKWIASASGDKAVQIWNISGNNVLTYRGHPDWVKWVEWSPNGQRIASGSYDHTVQVWNASDGNHVFTYRGHFGAITTLAWSPDGKQIASGSWDKTVQVWYPN